MTVRLRDEAGLSVGHVVLPAGADLRPATKGLPHDLCPCPHWGYMIKQGPDAHGGPAHGLRRRRGLLLGPRAPEALEDSEYVDSHPPKNSAV